MSVNKKNSRKAALKSASALTKARTALLAPVRKAAFNAGASRTVAIAAVKAACGRKPVLALYNAVKLELHIGFMAAALARRGDNREPETLMDSCRVALTKKSGFGGKTKLKAGQVGRRSKDEELAYTSARVQSSGLFRDAGVTVADKRGGDTSKTRAARPAAKATAKAAVNDTKPATPRYSDKADLLRYALIQSKAMLTTVNRNAKIAPVELKSAVQDFAAAIAKLA